MIAQSVVNTLQELKDEQVRSDCNMTGFECVGNWTEVH
jgi:hypothetical protein